MENDLDFYGSLTTEVVPEYVMIVVVCKDCTNISVKVLVKDEVLPVLKIPTLFINGPTRSGISHPFYTVDLKVFAYAFTMDYFINVKYKNFSYHRADFCNKLIVAEVQIEPNYELKILNEFEMKEFSDIDEIYQKTLSKR